VERRAAVFDMDGTLVDSVELAVRSARDGLTEYYARRGLPVELPSRSAIRAAVGLPSLEYFAALLPPERRADAEELRSCVVESELRQLTAGEGRLFPRALETLAALRGAGWALALVSNCGRPYFEANLRHQRLGPAFDMALCLDDGPSKPANVRRALQSLGASGGVMVGDRAADVEAGRAAGLATIGCRYGFGAPQELAAADHTIGSLDELPALVARLA
jgi:phosphoglycolate phosphatase